MFSDESESGDDQTYHFGDMVSVRQKKSDLASPFCGCCIPGASQIAKSVLELPGSKICLKKIQITAHGSEKYWL